MDRQVFKPGDRVRVTFTGTIKTVRADADGPAYAISHDGGYGYSYAKEAGGDQIELLEEPAGPAGKGCSR